MEEKGKQIENRYRSVGVETTKREGGQEEEEDVFVMSGLSG